LETEIGPDVASLGIMAVIEVLVDDAISAAVPLKATWSGLARKFEPVIVTAVPGASLEGLKPVIDGARLEGAL